MFPSYPFPYHPSSTYLKPFPPPLLRVTLCSSKLFHQEFLYNLLYDHPSTIGTIVCTGSPWFLGAVFWLTLHL